MQSFNIIKKTPYKESFRVNKLMGMFEMNDTHLEQNFTGTLTLPESWNVGIIVGRSGTGKSTIAKELFGITEFSSHADKPVVDDMPTNASVDDIAKTFTNVGFSSPPSWLKPYNVLSNGEKMRVDLAETLLKGDNLIVFDEFTSVVDRDVAKIVSMVVNKTARKENKQFVAVTCHYDVLDWLEPDWAFSTDTMQMLDVKKKDPASNSISTKEPLTLGECLKTIII